MEFNEKQVQIILVAEKLFADNGFDGTSIRHIAKKAGANIAMISYYFGSKDKLLEAILLYRASDFRMELESEIAKNTSYMEKLDAIIAFSIKRIHTGRRTHKIVNLEFSNRYRHIDFNKYIEQKKENLSILENFVKAGQEAGVFVKDVNVQLLTPTIFGTYFHFYYNKKFYMDILDLKNESDINNYVYDTLTKHIQKTIKALLRYED